MKLPKLKLSLNKKKADEQPAHGHESVQSWLPVQDIDDGMFYRPDGKAVGVIRVQPAAFTLLSDRERERRVTTLFEAIQSLPGRAQIVAVPRPIDLDQYLRDLDSRHQEADGARKRLLHGYKSYVRTIVAHAEAMEKRFFVLIPNTTDQADELFQKMREFVANLERADLYSHICESREILDLQFTFFNAAQAAFERAEGSDS